ncbi:hypothetical protein ABVT39_000919 [Epinephelus coioides]
MSSLNSSYTGSFRLDEAVLFTKDNSVRVVRSRPYLSAYRGSLCGHGIASFLLLSGSGSLLSNTTMGSVSTLFNTSLFALYDTRRRFTAAVARRLF